MDVFKGTESKKVKEFRHQQTSYFGSLKSWEKSDIQRLFHKLILEHYLTEEIVVMRDIPLSYVKVGNKVGDLMQRGAQVKFSVMEQKQVASKKKEEVKQVAKTSADEELDSQVADLIDKCYADLMTAAQELAEQRGIPLPTLVNMQAIIKMSELMPMDEEEMLQIPYVTKANFGKFGDKFLEVTIPYRSQKEMFILDRDERNKQENDEGSDDEEDDDNIDWDKLGSQAPKKGTKRKSSSWRGNKILKKYKASKPGKKKTPAKKGTAAKGKSVPKTWKSGASSGARKSNLLPPPKPSF